MKLKKSLRGAWIAVIVAILDRISKQLALKLGATAHIEWENVLRFRLTYNTGAAFSMFADSKWLLTAVIAALVLGVTAWLTARPDGQSRLMRVGLWMIVGGGIGNLYDRLVYGAVIDFIEPLFVRFAVFNIADSFICVGAALTVLAVILEDNRKKKGGRA